MPNRVKYYRELMGLTQKEVAEIIGISRQYLSEIENFKRNVGGRIIQALAKLLGVTTEELFFDHYS
ncbi:MAG: helix-turn-helix transcriptional regulator [Syntrophomonadaceae bacterium]|jgi:putative transcriptional regulator|nr:helix-turn-helix transcriptional regulator [Syntrophomonadaceae bacterium]